MKILILAYYYPPCNSIASLRPQSFAEYFAKNGYEVKVITRHWSGKEKIWPEFLESNLTPYKKENKSKNLDVIRLPYLQPKTNKLKTIYKYCTRTPFIDVNIAQFEKYISPIIKNWKPNYILTSAPPLGLVKLAGKLSKKNNTPLLLDFRDFENATLLKKDKKISLLERFFYNQRLNAIKPSLKIAHVISSISPPFIDLFKKYNHNVILITNGYDEGNFPKNHTTVKNKIFTLSLIGTIYPQQNYATLNNAMNKFCKNKNNVVINFIGAKANETVSDNIEKTFSKKLINITHKIDRNKAISIMKNSDILFYYGWSDHIGVYSGKIFEYLGARKNILLCPSDNDVIDQLLKETKSGVSLDTEKEVLHFLELKYKEWTEKGNLLYPGDEIEILKYTRHNQIDKIREYINPN